MMFSFSLRCDFLSVSFKIEYKLVHMSDFWMIPSSTRAYISNLGTVIITPSAEYCLNISITAENTNNHTWIESSQNQKANHKLTSVGFGGWRKSGRRRK